MRRFLLALALVASVAGATGCGLDLQGLGATADAGLPDSPSNDSVFPDATAITTKDGGGPDASPSGDEGAADAPIDVASADADEGSVGTPPADSGGADLGVGDAPGESATIADATGDSPVADEPEEDAPAVDGPVADAPVTIDAPTGGITVPAGWQLVVYAPGSPVCPATFPSHAAFGAASAMDGACTCSCNTVDAPTCTVGTLDTSFGGRQCDQDGASIDLPGSGCQQAQASLSARFAATPLPAQGGTCTFTAQGDPTQVTKASARFCDVPAPNRDDLLAGSPPAGFATCITMPGQTTCPGSSFTVRHVVEDDVNLVCSSCGPCTLTATCSNASIDFFADPFCNDLIVSLPVDGTCSATDSSGESISAVTYRAHLDTSCNDATSTPTTQLVNPRTICCLPPAPSATSP